MTVLVEEAVVSETCVIATPVDAATAGLVKEVDELTAMLLTVMVGFDDCSDAVVKGELLAALVTAVLALANMLFPRPNVPALGLKSLELLTIVAKLGRGPCSTLMFVGTLWTGLLITELGTGKGMLCSGDVGRSRSDFRIPTLRDLDKGLRGLPGPENM